ncbi:MAG: tetratricopeptide repeat protein [Acidobacteriota bacterium]
MSIAGEFCRNLPQGWCQRAKLRQAEMATFFAVLLAATMGFSPGSASDARGQCKEGVRAADAGRWEEAEFRWLKALAIDSSAACAYNNLAIRHEREGRYEKAEEAYRKALEYAEGAMRVEVIGNWNKFRETRETSETSATGESGSVVEEPGAVDQDDRVHTLEVTVSVPEEEGRGMANYERILVGNFVIADNDSGIDINSLAVRYFRRRLVQRTFFQTVDLLDEPLDPDRQDPLEDSQMWAERASRARADLVFTGRIGISMNNESRVVRENIRAPNGELTEVARFREMTGYRVKMEYVLLHGEDGGLLRAGELEASRVFPTDQNVAVEDAIVETFEELLPQVLTTITPKRTQQTRLLIY